MSKLIKNVKNSNKQDKSEEEQQRIEAYMQRMRISLTGKLSHVSICDSSTRKLLLADEFYAGLGNKT